MSCKHGNHDRGCDLCDAEEAAYSRGYKDGLSESSQPSAASGRELPIGEPELKPIAFLHDDPERVDVIHAEVKEFWLQCKPKHVEHYTIPLFDKDAASGAANDFFGKYYAKRYEELSAALSAAPADANVGGQAIQNEEFIVYVDMSPIDVGKHYADVHRMALPTTPTMNGYELRKASGRSGHSLYYLYLEEDSFLHHQIGDAEAVPLKRGMEFFLVPPATY